MVVYCMDKLDEISMSAKTLICEFKNGWYRHYTISPEDFGMNLCSKSELTGGLPEENAKITREILSGVDTSPKRDAVLLNAGASLYIADKVSSLADGIKLAQSLIDSGAAQETLNKFVEVSNR